MGRRSQGHLHHKGAGRNIGSSFSPRKAGGILLGARALGWTAAGIIYRSSLASGIGVLASGFPLSESEDGDDDVGVYTYNDQEG